ncbi:MAG: alpha-ketoglutarate-dependent dioxygenase AlkB [Jatrophihabitans sp.]|nr:MAG: alpha-ketoglutarate-dependent dioxygenase AlkB [Jatrophihabitans sp.]
MLALQASLLDLDDAPRFAPLPGELRRTVLDGPGGSAAGDGAVGGAAWFDLLPGWLTGADALFERLLAAVPWRAERRPMYDRVVDVPRLLCFYGEGAPLPDPALRTAKAALDAHYRAELGEPFATAGLCLYRDGRDSVAWHGDRIGRGATADTMVAIVSLGSPRPLLLRPRGGSTAHRLRLGHGDLFVMGGSCQRTWEHAVPKVSAGSGARISVQFRTRGVR